MARSHADDKKKRTYGTSAHIPSSIYIYIWVTAAAATIEKVGENIFWQPKIHYKFVTIMFA